MKIYTKTGDNGTTGLFAGPRVGKDHPRIQAYGSVDELNAMLGVAIAEAHVASEKDRQQAGTGVLPISSREASSSASDLADKQSTEESTSEPDSIVTLLQAVQSDLFSIGAELATPAPHEHGMCLIDDERIGSLEATMDALENELPPLTSFILPGGSLAAARLHLARTVCRRAERNVVALSALPDVADCSKPLIYLNRLSDLLFLLARQANSRAGIDDLPWGSPDRE